jgi:2-iminobutanoate/2-iminopropanoate deaminase
VENSSPPLSRTRRWGGLIFVSGQFPRDANGAIVRDDIRSQTKRVLDNISLALAEHGAGLSNVVKITVWLSDVCHLNAFNDAYGSQFSGPYPARSTVIAELVAAADVEMEAIACIEGKTLIP